MSVDIMQTRLVRSRLYAHGWLCQGVLWKKMQFAYTNETHQHYSGGVVRQGGEVLFCLWIVCYNRLRKRKHAPQDYGGSSDFTLQAFRSL